MASYNAYLYDDVEDVWAQSNNRNNKEALFIASGPQAGTDALHMVRMERINYLLSHSVILIN